MQSAGKARNRYQLVRRGAFARLWWAGAISSTGDWIELFATIALGDAIGGGTGALVALLAKFVPGLLFTPLGGILADRMDRKRTMIISDLGRAGLVLLLIFVSTLPQLFILGFFIEMLSLVRQPAREAAMPQLVSENELLGANSLSVLAAYGTFPVGALVWSAISKLPDWLSFETANALTIGWSLDAATFIASAAIVSTMSLPAPAGAGVSDRHRGWKSPFRDLSDGVRFVARHRGIRVVIFGLSTALVGGGALVAQGQTFARELLGGSISGFAVLATALGLGAMVGVLAVQAMERLPFHRMVVFGFALFVAGVGMSLLSLTTTVPGAALFAAILGAGSGVTYVTGFTYVHEKTDDDIRGRAFAALYTVARTAILLSMTVASFTAAVLNNRFPEPLDSGIRAVFLAGGIIILLTGVATLWIVREVLPGRTATTRT